MKDVIRMVGNTREYKVTADNMSDACDKVFEQLRAEGVSPAPDLRIAGYYGEYFIVTCIEPDQIFKPATETESCDTCKVSDLTHRVIELVRVVAELRDRFEREKT